MMLSQRIKSPAKVNLFLYLKGRDYRDYHLLQSLFYLLPDLYDLMDFSFKNEPGVEITTNHSIQNNLAKIAAELLLREAGLTNKIGIKIHLDKKIPIGGGFGGGSSNAATTLLTLNQDLNLGASLEDLVKIAEKIGDDVKIFLLQEEFIYLDSPSYTSVKIKLPFKVSYYDTGFTIFTRNIYDLARKNLVNLSSIIQSEKDLFYHILHGTNDLYPLAVQLEPRLEGIKQHLEQKYSLVRMTGSGGGFFMINF